MFASAAFRGTSGHGIYGDAVHEVDWSVGRSAEPGWLRVSPSSFLSAPRLLVPTKGDILKQNNVLNVAFFKKAS